jgi:hypothetical protein
LKFGFGGLAVGVLCFHYSPKIKPTACLCKEKDSPFFIFFSTLLNPSK